MKSIAPIALLALALFAAGSAWWMASSVREPERVALPAIEATSEDAAHSASEAFETLPSESRLRPEGEREVGTRASAASAPLRDAIVVEGRVLMPAGLPSDEEVSVVAEGKEFENGERTHVASVEADGRFRAYFAPTTHKGKIALRARYLLFDELERVRVREIEGELVLEPTLGGRVHGRVSLPTLRPGEVGGFEDVAVRLSVAGAARSATCDAEGRFELGPLPPDASAPVSAHSRDWLDVRIADVEVLPGAVTQVELALERGVALSGRVLEAGGGPLVGATVRTLSIAAAHTGSANDWVPLDGGQTVSSVEDGRFVMRGLRPGPRRVTAELVGFGLVEKELADLRDGDALDGLVLTLGDGPSLEGFVRWPDGRPAAKVDVVLIQRAQRLVVATKDDGRFRFAGLDPDPCELLARERPPESSEGTSALRPADWRASLLDVQPGKRNVELVLSAGSSARGRVVDDAGEPVKRFSIEADAVQVDGLLTTNRSQAFASSDGSFEMQGLSAGRWRLRARAHGHLESRSQELDVPSESGALELVLTRCGSFAGRVLDAQGEPVVGATIHRRDLDAEGRARGSSTARSVAKSGKGGGFDEPRAEPGRFALVARAEGYGESEPVELELAPAGELEDIVLHLRLAGRIEGVLRDTGDSIANRAIQVVHETGETQAARTDERGEFALGGLGPGRYRVVLLPSERGQVLRGLVGSLTDHETAVDLAPGATARVVLPTEPAHAIVVHGRVTVGDRPVAGCALGWVSTRSSRRTGALSDEDGRYRVVLDVPGTWGRVASFGNDTVASGSVEVPDARTFEHDVALPTGRISGTLRDEDGRALVGLQVSIPPGVLSKSLNRPPRRRTTDEDGRYAFEYVPAGTVQVVAGGSDSLRAGEDEFAASELTVELSDGERRDGVDLVLHPGGTIEGRVVDAVGRPVQDSIRLIASTGQLRTVHRSDPDGSFRIPGLAPGSYGIVVGRSKEATHTARVEAGRVTSIDLVRND